MSIRIDRQQTRAMTRHFDEALELIQNEFAGLDPHKAYRNAFARLLKSDPLQRVLMMGTMGRDLFVPVLRDEIKRTVPPGGHILDLGAGNGQTFALVADSVPAGVTVSILEPDVDSASDYRGYLATQRHLRSGMALMARFEEIDEAARRTGAALPSDGTVDLVLALQMIFFFQDLPASLTRMARFLKPGGTLFIVVVDDTDNFLELAVRNFIESGGQTGDNDRYLATVAERVRLLSAPDEGGGGILDVLRTALPSLSFELESSNQPNRLYGHTLGDIMAFVNLGILSEVYGTAKFMSTCNLLLQEPATVDLRIEDEGPRMGMWSVKSPQRIAVVRRIA